MTDASPVDGKCQTGELMALAMAIEAGRGGWDLIEFQELLRSAEEQFGEESIVRVVSRRRLLRPLTILHTLYRSRPQYFVLDPRSGSQHAVISLLQSFLIFLALSLSGTTPILWLTDPAVRRWRRQAGLITARRGIILTMLDPESSDIPLPHGRVLGPNLMPLSAATFEELARRKEDRPKPRRPSAVFAGSLYEPRTTFLREIARGLESTGHCLEIHARGPSGARVPNQVYWQRLLDADVVITTAAQTWSPGMDRSQQNQLVYRYTEALACGTALVAPFVPGSDALLRAGRDYRTFSTVEEAVLQITQLLEDDSERSRIAEAGHATLRTFVQHGEWWRRVAMALGEDGAPLLEAHRAPVRRGTSDNAESSISRWPN